MKATNLDLNEKDLAELLLLEKERRGVERDKLLLIGTADTANYYWCAMKSLLANKDMELGFFASYLEDRVEYSLELGYINSIPANREKLLDVGDEITLDDIEKLLAERAQEMQERDVEDAVTIIDKEGNRIMVLNPDLSPEERRWYEEEAKREGISIVSAEEVPTVRGEFLHISKAERYPTIRWNFPWKDYVVVGVPDGITDSFVYEFKSTRSNYLLRFIRPVAFTQADLYGYFFRRGTKRVQIHVQERDDVLTWVENVDANNAEDVLQKFRRLEEEGEEPLPPKEWKCRKCKFKEICPLYRRKFKRKEKSK